MKDKRIQIRCSEKTIERLKVVAKTKDLNVASLVMSWIQENLEKEEEKSKNKEG